MPSKPTAKDAMTYMLDPDNPRTKFHGNFERFISGTRWYKSSTVIMVKDKGKDDSEICELKFKHHTPYKTSLREYGHQLQQIINELFDDKIYYPESCVISFQVFNTEYKINAGKLDDAEKENIDSIYKRLSYDKRTLIAIDAIVYPDIITTRVSAMLDLTAAIKNYHEAYAMVLNRDNAFEIYQKYVKEN